MIRPDYRVFRNSRFIVGCISTLEHSAKGSTWEDHKYIKRINGTYYYPDSYEGGRHLADGSEENKSSDDNAMSELEDMTGMTRESLTEFRELGRESGYDSKEFKEMLNILSEGDEEQAKKMIDLLKQGESEMTLSSNDIENLAKEVIRGNFGNGQVRKDLLGRNYEKIQRRVNEMIKGSTGSKKVSDASESSVKKAEEIAKKVSIASTPVTKSIDINQVLSVYNKKK